jgi:lysophospholipase L1-like esterase
MASNQTILPGTSPVSAVSKARRSIARPDSDVNSLRRLLTQASMLLLFATAAACSSDDGGSPGAGGHVGGGGATGTGGSQVGSGGSTGTGGSGAGGVQVGSGGSVAKGGDRGSGGSGAGGVSGSGGTAGGGGPGTGGARMGGATGTSGGATGSGGSSAGQGGSSAAGDAGMGGSGTGGSAGRDGAAGQGGRETGGVGGQTTGAGGARPDGGSGGATGTGGGTGTTFNPCTAGAACKIMPLGDSITEGFGTSSASGGPANQGGYRIELFRQTVKNAKNITFVGSLTNGPTTVESKTFPQKHEGHGGWTISQISGIADSTLSTNKPDIVLLKIGTNDVNGTGASSAPTGLKNLITQITKDVPNALLLVSSIIPIKDDNTNQKVKTYNATIPTAVSDAAAAGKHVVFVDSYAAFLADSSWKTKYMSDNLHPNDTGYALLGQTWYAAISSVLPASP